MSAADVSPEQVLLDAGIEEPGERLLGFITRQRWFGGRGREATGLRILSAGRVPGKVAVFQVLAEVSHATGEPERYQVPLSVRSPGDDPPGDHAVVARTAAGGLVLDALDDPAAALQLWRLIAAEGEARMSVGRLLGRRRADLTVPDEPATIRPLGRDQSNTSLLREEAELLKFFRRVDSRSSPEIEMLEALDAAGFRHIAAPSGVMEYHEGEEATVLAILQPYLHNATDGFQMAMTSLRDLYDVAVEEVEPGADVRQVVDEQGSDFTPEAVRLGRVIGEMHVALASPAMPPEMAPDQAGRDRLAAWSGQMTAELDALQARHPDRLHDVPVERLRQSADGGGRAGGRRHRGAAPWRSPPRPAGAYRRRLDRPRFRGRARPAGQRKAGAVVAAPRRGGHAALLRLRRRGRAGGLDRPPRR